MGTTKPAAPIDAPVGVVGAGGAGADCGGGGEPDAEGGTGEGMERGGVGEGVEVSDGRRGSNKWARAAFSIAAVAKKNLVKTYR